jgi:hypothetical protein
LSQKSCKLQISIYLVVLKLIQIQYIHICYIQFCINLDTFGYKFVSKIQIVVNQFVRKMTAKKNLQSEKNWSPLIPRYAGIQKFSTKENGVQAKHMENSMQLVFLQFQAMYITDPIFLPPKQR